MSVDHILPFKLSKLMIFHNQGYDLNETSLEEMDGYRKRKFERTHLHSEQNIQSKRIWIAALISFLFILNLFTGCSHLKPYYRSNFNPSKILFAEEKDLRIRLLFIGDAGATKEKDPVMKKLGDWATKTPHKTMVIYLGDNIYPAGMPSKEDSEREEAERRILAQIEVIKKSGARGFFIPGNHDWKRGLPGLIREENFVKQELGRDDVFLPTAGCPGPVKIDVENIRIIIMDTYFWLNREINPEEGCPHKDLKASMATLKTLLQTAGDREVVFMAHIPLDTHGPHGGFFDWRDHLFPFTRLVKWLWIPLPVIGSLYPLLRWNVVKYSQDLNSTVFKNMSKQLKEAFAIRKPLIYAAGHDHSLQVLDMREAVEYILVSGAGSISMLSSVRHSDNTLFAHLHEGFMSVDFLKDGSVWMYVVEPGENDVIFFKELKTN
jgi:hypothetical protein